MDTIGGIGLPLLPLPERGQYVVAHVSEDGSMWAALPIAREVLLGADAPGDLIVHLLDEYIEALRSSDGRV